MVTITAIVAILISISSLAFSIQQYRILHKVRIGEKVSSVLRSAYDLRRKSEELKHKIEATDNTPDCPELFTKISTFTEQGIGKLCSSQKLSWEQLHALEQKLLELELEVDLFHKQVMEVDRFNREAQAHDAARPRKGKDEITGSG